MLSKRYFNKIVKCCGNIGTIKDLRSLDLVCDGCQAMELLAALMVSSHLFSCDVRCCSCSCIGVLKSDFSFNGTRCWSLV